MGPTSEREHASVRRPATEDQDKGRAAAGHGASGRDLMFLNVSNPADSQNRRNKRIVKKWASVNNQRQPSPSPDPDAGDQSESQLGHATAWPKPQKIFWMGTLSGTGDGDLVEDRQEVASIEDVVRRPKRQKPPESAKEPAQAKLLATKRSKSVSRNQGLGSGKLSASDHETAHGRSTRRKSTGSHLVSPDALTLGAGNKDPFDALPIPTTDYHHRLLYLYANAELFTKRQTHESNGCDAFAINTFLKQSIWIPLAMKSKSTYSALMAFTASTPRLQLHPRNQHFLAHHLTVSLRALSEDLNDPKRSKSDATCFAVSLLLLVAQYTSDWTAYHAHAKGLAQILGRRIERGPDEREETPAPASRRVTPEIRLHVEEDTAAETTAVPRPELIYPRHSPQPPEMYGEKAWCGQNPVTPPPPWKDSRAGFTMLLRHRLLSLDVFQYIHQIVSLSQLGEHAGSQADWLPIMGFACHVNFEDFLPKPPMHALDTAFVLTIRMCLHSIVHSNMDFDDAGTEWMISSLLQVLTSTNLEDVRTRCPESLLWIALVAGPYTLGARRHWFGRMARYAQAESFILTQEEATGVLKHRFLLPEPMTLSAEEFWVEAMTHTDDWEDVVLDMGTDDATLGDLYVQTAPPEHPYVHPPGRTCTWRRHLADYRAYHERRLISYLPSEPYQDQEPDPDLLSTQEMFLCLITSSLARL